MDLLDKMRSKGRAILFATEGSEELRYLDAQGANANVGGETCTHILLREDPRFIEVWEEFLHGTQFRCGLFTDRSMSEGQEALEECEEHVKEFMIRHARLIGICEADVKILQVLRGGSHE
jgi:hypothetical protein